MIYILGDDFMIENEGLEDVIYMASTKIDDVLEYLYNNVEIHNLCNYAILIKSENDYTFCSTINPSIYAYDNFSKNKPSMFFEIENDAEYKHIKDQLFIWCNALKVKIQKEKEERDRMEAEKKEKQERKLYEKLKAKYGD